MEYLPIITMSERNLRNRTIVDYNALHSGMKGKNASKISVGKELASPQMDRQGDLHPEISNELQALEVEEARLRLEIALAAKRNEIRLLQSELQKSDNLVEEQVTQHLPAVNNQPLPSNRDHEVTLKDLSKDKDLETALSFLKGSHLDFLDKQPAHTSTADQHNIQGKSLFLIPDFISKPNASYTSNTERDKVKRVEDVTAAQWISANSKILMKLITEGMEMLDVQRYLRYTIKVGDYLQMAETSSVMLLDNEHRRQVQEEGRQWDNIDSDKVYFYLKAQSAGPAPKQKFKQVTDENGKPICLRYNKGACYMSFCKYAHVCLVCKGDHPKVQHGVGQSVTPPPSQPPRFRQY